MPRTPWAALRLHDASGQHQPDRRACAMRLLAAHRNGCLRAMPAMSRPGWAATSNLGSAGAAGSVRGHMCIGLRPRGDGGALQYVLATIDSLAHVGPVR